MVVTMVVGGQRIVNQGGSTRTNNKITMNSCCVLVPSPSVGEPPCRFIAHISTYKLTTVTLSKQFFSGFLLVSSQNAQELGCQQGCNATQRLFFIDRVHPQFSCIIVFKRVNRPLHRQDTPKFQPLNPNCGNSSSKPLLVLPTTALSIPSKTTHQPGQLMLQLLASAAMNEGMCRRHAQLAPRMKVDTLISSAQFAEMIWATCAQLRLIGFRPRVDWLMVKELNFT